MQRVTHDSGSVGAQVRPTLLCSCGLPGAVGAAGGPTVLMVDEVTDSALAIGVGWWGWWWGLWVWVWVCRSCGHHPFP